MDDGVLQIAAFSSVEARGSLRPSSAPVKMSFLVPTVLCLVVRDGDGNKVESCD